MRVEVFYSPRFTDGRAVRLQHSLNAHFDLGIRALRIIDVYIIEGLPLNLEQIREVFVDTVVPDYNAAFYERLGYASVGEHAYQLPGVNLRATRLRKVLKQNL